MGDRFGQESLDEGRSKRERITIRLTNRQMACLNELISRGVFMSRNEAIRFAMSLLFERYELKLAQKE